AAAVRSEDDLGRFSLLRALAQDLDLVEAREGTLVPGKAAQTFMALPPEERLARVLDAYRRTRRWFELYRLPHLGIRHRSASIREMPELFAGARPRVVAELAELAGEAANVWIGVRHLIERLRERAYEFLLPRDRAYASWSSFSGFEANPY